MGRGRNLDHFKSAQNIHTEQLVLELAMPTTGHFDILICLFFFGVFISIL